MKQPSALDKIVSAFADSVTDGDFEGAEGWFALARDHAERQVPKDARKAGERQSRRARRS